MIPFPVLDHHVVAVHRRAADHVLRPPPPAVRLIALVTTTVSAVLSVFIFVVYEREAAGFQFRGAVHWFRRSASRTRSVHGMSLLMVLLTSIIIFAGVFASWTVSTRSQEFYALLLALVTGVYGVFVSWISSSSFYEPRCCRCTS